MARQVHLVGSIGLDTVPEVFSAVGGLLGTYVSRVPDGEPGGRRMWIGWQYPLLRSSPFLQVDAEAGKRTNNGYLPLRVADGTAVKDISFSELGYAREARASYLDFVAAREKGVLPANVRFQVCLPTPYSVVRMACVPSAIASVEPAYDRAMMRELQMVCDAIPHKDLCIQWDICTEMQMLDGRVHWYQPMENLEGFLRERFVRQAAAVPDDVELGYHLCYGDLDGRHSIEPIDTTKLVEMANLIASSAPRAVAYIHMPVPISRDDEAYYLPLRDLKFNKGTKLFLGLVHAGDGVAGTTKRVEAAARIRPDFGIACECGISRAKTPAIVEQILHIHSTVAAN